MACGGGSLCIHGRRKGRCKEGCKSTTADLAGKIQKPKVSSRRQASLSHGARKIGASAAERCGSALGEKSDLESLFGSEAEEIADTLSRASTQGVEADEAEVDAVAEAHEDLMAEVKVEKPMQVEVVKAEKPMTPSPTPPFSADEPTTPVRARSSPAKSKAFATASAAERMPVCGPAGGPMHGLASPPVAFGGGGDASMSLGMGGMLVPFPCAVQQPFYPLLLPTSTPAASLDHLSSLRQWIAWQAQQLQEAEAVLRHEEEARAWEAELESLFKDIPL